MLPTRNQFSKWSYPTKFGFVTAFIGLLLSIAFWLFPDAGKQLIDKIFPLNSKQALVGTWKGTTNCKYPSGEITILGYTQLLNTGPYNFSGEVKIQTSNRVTMLLHAYAAGTWSATDHSFVISALDIKTIPHTFREFGKSSVDLTNPLLIPQELLLRIEKFTPQGSSQEYEIVELTSKRLRAYSKDLRGNIIVYKAVRES